MFENTWNEVSLLAFCTDDGQSSGYRYIQSLLRTPKNKSVWLLSEWGLSNKPGTIPVIFPQDDALSSTKSLDSLNGWWREKICVYSRRVYLFLVANQATALPRNYWIPNFFSFQRILKHISLKKKKNPCFPNCWIFNFLLHWERYQCTRVESTCWTSTTSKPSNSCQT